MTIRDSGSGLSNLAKSVAIILYFLLQKNYQVLALKDHTVRDIQTILLANDTLRISWDVVEPRQPRKRWNFTHVTLQRPEAIRSVRYPLRRDIYSVDYGLDDNGMPRGAKYDVLIQLVDEDFTAVSDEESGAVIIPPRKPVSFSATLSYHNLSRDGYPRFIEFNYHLQRNSLYSGVKIECGNRSADGTLSIRFKKEIDFTYSSKGENVALGRPTAMFTTRTTTGGFLLNSSYAVDGKIWLNVNHAQTDNIIIPKWWVVQLDRILEIQKVIYYNYQSRCGNTYCSTLLQSFKIFSSNSSDSEPCKSSTKVKKRSTRYSLPYEMVFVETFKPTFLARYIAICGFLYVGKPLTLIEVEVFEAEQPIEKTEIREIQLENLLPGTPIDCDVHAIATISGDSILSKRESLAQKILTAPPPPRNMVYRYREDGSHLISFVLDTSLMDMYTSKEIVFILDGHLFTLSNTLEHVHRGQLLAGQRYVLETWTSTTLPVGKVKSLQNATFEFVAGGVGIIYSRHVTTKSRTDETTKGGLQGTAITALYVIIASGLLFFSLAIVILIHRKSKQKKADRDIPKVRSAGHVYAGLMTEITTQDIVSKSIEPSTVETSFIYPRLISDNVTQQTQSQSNSEHIRLGSLPPTPRIQQARGQVAPRNMVVPQTLNSVAPSAQERTEYSMIPEPYQEVGLYDTITKRKTKVKNSSK